MIRKGNVTMTKIFVYALVFLSGILFGGDAGITLILKALLESL